MDWIGIRKKVTGFVSKYRYVLLVLLIGLAFMLIPSGESRKNEEPEAVQTVTQKKTDIAEELTNILTQIEGAGKVKVMLTVEAGETTIFHQDEDITGGESSSIHRETVIITDSNRGQSALIEQVNPPKSLGAVIVCEGAERAAVRLNIIEAVSKVTGLGADRISVLKMK